MEFLDSPYFIHAVAVLLVLLYWEAREIFTSIADKKKGQHGALPRLLIRLILPVVGAGIILQLLGLVPAAVALPEVFEEPLRILGQLVFWGGFLLAFWARETIGRHWAHAAEYQVVKSQDLVTDGPYAYIRHPIYTALFAIFLGAQMLTSTWLILLTPLLYWFIHWQASKEEELLIKKFKKKYRDYQAGTGMILPRI